MNKDRYRSCRVLLFAAPWIVSSPFFVHLMIMVLMWAVLGASWNILGGFTGQVSFGHATFLGAGAYTTMILFLKLGIAPWYGIPIGGLVAALIALPIGYICFRLRGPYFALSTLAVAEIVRLVALNWESLTNGPVGLLITTLPDVTFWGRSIDWENKIPFYYIIAVIALAAMVATYIMSRTRLGAYSLAIREDIDSAEAIGINTVRTRVAALSLSAFFAGVARRFLCDVFTLYRSGRRFFDRPFRRNGLYRRGGWFDNGGRSVDRSYCLGHLWRDVPADFTRGAFDPLRSCHDVSHSLHARGNLGKVAALVWGSTLMELRDGITNR